MFGSSLEVGFRPHLAAIFSRSVRVARLVCTETLKATLPGFQSFRFNTKVRDHTLERDAIFHPIHKLIVFVLSVGALDQHQVRCLIWVYVDGARMLKRTFAFASEQDLQFFVRDIFLISVGIRLVSIDHLHNRHGILRAAPIPIRDGEVICESWEIQSVTAIDIDSFWW